MRAIMFESMSIIDFIFAFIGLILIATYIPLIIEYYRWGLEVKPEYKGRFSFSPFNFIRHPELIFDWKKEYTPKGIVHWRKFRKLALLWQFALFLAFVLYLALKSWELSG